MFNCGLVLRTILSRNLAIDELIVSISDLELSGSIGLARGRCVGCNHKHQIATCHGRMLAPVRVRNTGTGTNNALFLSIELYNLIII